MALIYDGDFTEAVAVGPLVPSYPFPADRVSAVWTQDFMQRIDRFEPRPLDSPNDDYPDAFLVNESTPEPVGGGIGRFTRTWARVPASRKEMETFSYTVPGVVLAGGVVTVRYIDSASTAGASTSITTTTNHNYNAGDWVIISYYVLDQSENLIFRREVFREVRTTPSAATFTVDAIIDANPILSWSTTYPSFSGRKPFQRVVPSWLQWDYFLPGVSAGISDPSAIEIFQPTLIIDNAGQTTDSYSDVTAPTLTDYRAQVQNRELVVAEPSTVRRWMGNIFERVTRYVVAI